MSIDTRAGSGIAGDSLVHHLNMTADIGKGQLSNYADCTFIFGLSEEVSKQFIYVLQDFFQSNKLGQAYNDKLKKTGKEVIIMDEWALDTQLLPQIVVKSMPVDNIPVSLGNRLGKEEFENQIFETYGGMANLATSLDIYAQGKAAVCSLADIVFLSLMQYVKDRLMQVNISVQPQIRFSSANKVTGVSVGGEVYRISLSVPVIGEWKQYLEIETVDTNSIVHQPTVN